MRHSLRNRLAVAILALAFGATAFGYAQAEEPIVIKWGGTPSVELMTPLFVAISQGYLAEEGLEIDNVMMGPGARVREALAAGEIDFADLGTMTYVVGRQAGLKQRLVFEYYTKEIFSLFVREDLKGTVKSVADLQGMKLTSSALGSSSHMAGLAFIKKAGLENSDVSFVGLGSGDPATMITAMESGQFAGGIFWEPASTYLIDRKVAFPLVDIRDSEAHSKWIGANASSMVLGVSEEFIETRPEVIQRAVRALKKALVYIHSNSAKDVAKATSALFKMDEDILARILEPIKPNFSTDGRLSKSGLDVEASLVVGGGLITKKLAYEEMVDVQFSGGRD